MNKEQIIKYIEQRIENAKERFNSYKESYIEHSSKLHNDPAQVNYRAMLQEYAIELELQIVLEHIKGEKGNGERITTKDH